MKSSRNAVISATIASAIGISIATNVRKTKSSTMIAASRPSASEAALLERRELGRRR